MGTSPHEFVTVDMRGLKASLIACAAQRRVSVSVVVRAAVLHELGQPEERDGASAEATTSAVGDDGWTKLSIRMRRSEATRLEAGARAAKLSRGAYLAGLVEGVPVLLAGGGRSEHIAALTASCAELSTFRRNLRSLTGLLRVGDIPAALAYRDLLDRVADDVRRHLSLAAQVLADLRPGRLGVSPEHAPGSRRRQPWQAE